MLDRSNPTPLHQQLEQYIHEKLASKEWRFPNAIPSENELSRMFSISRMTVRSVITKLVHEELLERRPGKGTFVKEEKIVTKSLSYAGIREQLEQMGHEISTQVLSFERRRVSENTLQHFSVPPDTEFYVLNRLRCLQDDPLSIHTSYMPVYLCPGLEEQDLKNEQLCIILNNVYNLERDTVVETLESVAASKAEAELLHLPANYPLLRLEDVISSLGGVVFEYARVIFRGDKLKMRFEFK
jgi:GntR family transcriptional regulator